MKRLEALGSCVFIFLLSNIVVQLAWLSLNWIIAITLRYLHAINENESSFRGYYVDVI